MSLTKPYLNLKKPIKIALYAIIACILLELILRFGVGLGDIPVYVEDEDYEYIMAPNQSVKRFGNRIETNAYSMRSAMPAKEDRFRILKFGDSIINGGNHTTQDSLASEHLKRDLNAIDEPAVNVLNVSAGSWGPDNAFAYLTKHGHFDADVMVLVFSSHDLHDNMHFRKVVGEHPAWPDSKPLLAMTDLFVRYVIPKIKSWFGQRAEYEYLVGFDDSKINSGLYDFPEYCKENDIPLLFYLHPTREELKNDSYNENGQQLIKIMEENDVTVIQGFNTNLTDDCYRDQIHLNDKGQRVLAETLYNHLEKMVNTH